MSPSHSRPRARSRPADIGSSPAKTTHTFCTSKSSGRKVRLHKKGNAFVIRMQILPPGDRHDHYAQKEIGRLLGELGSPGRRTEGSTTCLRTKVAERAIAGRAAGKPLRARTGRVRRGAIRYPRAPSDGQTVTGPCGGAGEQAYFRRRGPAHKEATPWKDQRMRSPRRRALRHRRETQEHQPRSSTNATCPRTCPTARGVRVAFPDAAGRHKTDA